MKTLKTVLFALLWSFLAFGVLALLTIFLTSCIALPTLPPTPTVVPTLTEQPTLPPVPTLETAPASVGNVTVTGNVWIRDGANTQLSVLMAGTRVNAVCDGQWCVLHDSGGATDFKFWRGCSDNNPDSLTCSMAD